MLLFDTTQLALERAMSGASLRQSAIADNLANANTPGYQRRDVPFEATLRSAMQGGSASVAAAPMRVEQDTGQALRADGNGVDVDAESAAMARNGLTYQTLVQIARGRIDVLESAMGTRG